MQIPIASDHAGYKAKEKVKEIIRNLGHEPIDLGTHSDDSVDYPEYAIPVSEKVNKGDYSTGILVCGSGQGMCMTANKYERVRAALVYNENSARMTRQHNNANILCLPGRELDENALKKIVEIWLNTNFEGGRHERRINKITSLTSN